MIGREDGLAAVDHALGRSLRGAIVATLTLGHTDMRHTAATYLHADDGDDIAAIIILALLGDADEIRRRYPNLTEQWIDEGMAKVAALTPREP